MHTLNRQQLYKMYGISTGKTTITCCSSYRIFFSRKLKRRQKKVCTYQIESNVFLRSTVTVDVLTHTDTNFVIFRLMFDTLACS